MKSYSRKQFIKMSAAAGAALMLNACGVGSNEKKAGDNTSAVPPAKSIKSGDPTRHLDLVEKNDPRYDILRRGFNKRVDKHPQVIALCGSTADVAAAVIYAHEKGLPIAVKSGGHSMEGFSCSDGGMVINLSKMNSVEMLADHRIKAGPGCILSQLYDTILLAEATACWPASMALPATTWKRQQW